MALTAREAFLIIIAIGTMEIKFEYRMFPWLPRKIQYSISRTRGQCFDH